jgi:hypothetical protein
VAHLGANSDGEILVPAGCRTATSDWVLDPSGTAEAPRVLVVAPAARLRPVSYGRSVPSADARL